jgi:hypothetical protein
MLAFPGAMMVTLGSVVVTACVGTTAMLDIAKTVKRTIARNRLSRRILFFSST